MYANFEGEIIERQREREREMNGGRFNFVLHSKNQAHDLLSCSWHRLLRLWLVEHKMHFSIIWSLQTAAKLRIRDLINMLIGEFSEIEAN